MLYKITSFYESQIYGNLLNYFIIQLWHVLHNKYWITYFGYDKIRDRRINICDKVWIYIHDDKREWISRAVIARLLWIYICFSFLHINDFLFTHMENHTT